MSIRCYLNLEQINKYVIIHLKGKCEVGFANEVHEKRSEFDDYLDNGILDFIVDFSSITHVSSTALSIWMMLKRTIEKKKGSIVFAGVSEDILKIFKVTNYDKVFKMYLTLEEAIKEIEKR